MTGSCSVVMACLKSRKNNTGSVSKEESGEEMVCHGEVLIGSTLRLAHTAEHITHWISAEDVCGEVWPHS